MNKTSGYTRRPDWLRIPINETKNYKELKALKNTLNLTTVCEEARCPNIYECWENKTATFMLFGDICTRSCGFCSVETGKPLPLQENEIENVAKAVLKLGLRHVVITSVNRDDLLDGGAMHFAKTIQAVRFMNPDSRIEILIPDFKANKESLDIVLEAKPDIIAHNIETVPRLYRNARPGSLYKRSLEVLSYLKSSKKTTKNFSTKSGIMCGLGETEEELKAVFKDLSENMVDIITIGQYMQPRKSHLPVLKYYTKGEFEMLSNLAKEYKFLHVESGPLVRSSYNAHKHVENIYFEGHFENSGKELINV